MCVVPGSVGLRHIQMAGTQNPCSSGGPAPVPIPVGSSLLSQAHGLLSVSKAGAPQNPRAMLSG